MKRIALITGTRAEYGIMRPLIKKLQDDSEIELSLLVTGMHLSADFGETYKEIERDGFEIAAKIDVLAEGDSKRATALSISRAIDLFSEHFQQNKYDIVVVLGDRFEIFAAVSAAAVLGQPVCHISGGDTTEGATDEFFRHCITKMSSLHFPSTEEFAKRVIQMGEQPETVFNVGNMTVENIVKLEKIDIESLSQFVGFSLEKPFFMVTFHPVTLEENTAEKQVEELLRALDKFSDYGLIITKANADSGGRTINKMLEQFAENRENTALFTSMGAQRYLSAMSYATLVIGNSSSGLCETPSFKIPTINIGDRQKGRIMAKSVICAKPLCEDIIKAIEKGLSEEFCLCIKDVVNPYGDGETSDRIIKILKNSEKPNLKKIFYDLEV